VSSMWRNGLVCHIAVAMVAWSKSVALTTRPSFHVNECARRSGCRPAMDRNPRAMGTPAAPNRPQNPSNSGSGARSLVPASMSQAWRGMRLGLNDKSDMCRKIGRGHPRSNYFGGMRPIAAWVVFDLRMTKAQDPKARPPALPRHLLRVITREVMDQTSAQDYFAVH